MQKLGHLYSLLFRISITGVKRNTFTKAFPVANEDGQNSKSSRVRGISRIVLLFQSVLQKWSPCLDFKRHLL